MKGPYQGAVPGTRLPRPPGWAGRQLLFNLSAVDVLLLPWDPGFNPERNSGWGALRATGFHKEPYS
jgi:hypothetical protein